MNGRILRVPATSYPGRRVVSADAHQLFARGGGIHCMMQHQPSAI